MADREPEVPMPVDAMRIIRDLSAERSRLERERDAKADEVAVLAGELDEAKEALRKLEELFARDGETPIRVRERLLGSRSATAEVDERIRRVTAARALLARLGAGGEED